MTLLAGFLDVLLRGLGLIALSAAVGGVAYAVVLFVLHPWVLADANGQWPVLDFVVTAFGRASLVGIALALALAAVAARLRRAPAARAGWMAAGAIALLLLTNSAWLAHAVSRLEGRGPLMLATVFHQAG